MPRNSYRWKIVETSDRFLTKVVALEPYREDGNRNYRTSGKWVPNFGRIEEYRTNGWRWWSTCHFREYRNKNATLRALRSLLQRFPTANFQVWYEYRVPKTGKWMVRTWTFGSSV